MPWHTAVRNVDFLQSTNVLEYSNLLFVGRFTSDIQFLFMGLLV